MSFRAGLAVSAALAAAGFPLVPSVPTVSHPVQAARTKLR
jgi:hypothetical protein